MQVEIDGRIEYFDKAMTVKEIFKILNLNPEVYLAISENGELITSDRIVKADEKIKIIRVVSGG